MWKRKLYFFMLLTTLLVIGFFSTSYISYYVANDSMSSQIENTTLPLISDNIYSEIQHDLLRLILISSVMAQDTFVRDWIIEGEQDEVRMIHYLKEIQKQHGTITSFFISEKTRKYYHSSGILKTVNQMDSQDSWYFNARKIYHDYEINVGVDTADKTSVTIFINHRVYDYQGKYIGIIGVGLALNAVKKLIENYNSSYGRKIYFIDKEGKITLRGLSYNGEESIYKIKELSLFIPKIFTSSNSSIIYNKNGSKYYLNSRFIPELNWYLIVEDEENKVQKRIKNTLMINVGFGFALSIIIVLLVNLIIVRYQRQLEIMATTDKLTGASNRQIFGVLFNQAHKQSKRSKTTLSAIMFDIDYFKKVNDTYGHPTGDVVLRVLTKTIAENIRGSDILFRWGGEEFLIILPECDLIQARKIAEKIRQVVEKKKVLFARKSLSVTISLGVTSMHENETSDDLVHRLDKALYTAKESGRNQVVVIN